VEGQETIAALWSGFGRERTVIVMYVNALNNSSSRRWENIGAVAGGGFEGARETIVAQECW
jgi:hypothetical protein